MSELRNKIIDHLSERVQKSELNNDDLVAIIDRLGLYLNLETISAYSTREKISYNGVLSRIESGKIKEYQLFGVKFVIDNE